MTTAGYSEACALGMKGLCIIPSKRMFQLMLELFRRSVDGDFIPVKVSGAMIKNTSSRGKVII